MKSHFKNLKSLERNQLKSIMGGRVPCPANNDCGAGNCCISGACHPISDAGPRYGLCSVIIEF